MKISFGYFLNCLHFVSEEVAVVNRNGNVEKNYHDLQALNCVDYKDNRKKNMSWAYKAAFFVCENFVLYIKVSSK